LVVIGGDLTILVVLTVVVVHVIVVIFNFIKLKLVAWVLNERGVIRTGKDMREKEKRERSRKRRQWL
jgi:hypothetical protein